MIPAFGRLAKYIVGYTPTILVVVLITLLWYLIAPFIPAYLIPSPSSVLSALLSPQINWGLQTWVTTYETTAGFALSAIIGVPLAFLLVYSARINKIVYPIILALQIVPKSAVAPIFFLMLGFSDIPRILTVFSISFFVIVLNTIVGLNSLEPGYVDLFRVFGGSTLAIFLKARLPNALPNVFASFKVAITVALVGAIVAEFVEAERGLGLVLITSLTQLGIAVAFASLTIVTLVGFALYLAVEVAERVTIPWYAKSKKVQV
jgi:NitT/TauT family transport system permease protein